MRGLSRAVLRDSLYWLGPAVLGFIVLTYFFPETKLAELLRLLLLAAVVVFSVRHGWRGAAFSVLIVSIALGVEDHLGAAPHSPIWLQMFVAIAGAMALMFGVTVDQLRQRSDELLATREQERRFAEALVEAAARNVRVEEAERGRIAMDLHDSLGQGITALQTQIKLAELEAGESARVWTPGLRELVEGMRDGVREVLEALRPAALRELGLAKAVDLGAIRSGAERAGARFDVDVFGSATGLGEVDEAASVVAYRIVQEAVTNALRHGHAHRIRVRFRIGWWPEGPWSLVAVDDDGAGLSPGAREGRGIQGMRDRALLWAAGSASAGRVSGASPFALGYGLPRVDRLRSLLREAGAAFLQGRAARNPGSKAGSCRLGSLPVFRRLRMPTATNLNAGCVRRRAC